MDVGMHIVDRSIFARARALGKIGSRLRSRLREEFVDDLGRICGKNIVHLGFEITSM
jgi:hypothetical protein